MCHRRARRYLRVVERARSDGRTRGNGEPLERERWTRAVADQAFTRDIVIGGDGDRGVEVEAVERDGVLAGPEVVVRAGAITFVQHFGGRSIFTCTCTCSSWAVTREFPC